MHLKLLAENCKKKHIATPQSWGRKLCSAKLPSLSEAQHPVLIACDIIHVKMLVWDIRDCIAVLELPVKNLKRGLMTRTNGGAMGYSFGNFISQYTTGWSEIVHVLNIAFREKTSIRQFLGNVIIELSVHGSKIVSHQRWIWGIHCMQAIKHASRDPPWLWSPGADITRGPKQGYQWSHIKGLMSSKNYFLKKNIKWNLFNKYLSVGFFCPCFNIFP